MEQGISGTGAPVGIRTATFSQLALAQFRLILGWIILSGTIVELFAVSWDIQWHSAVGRDRTLTAPHLFILGSITVIGLAALAGVLIETAWARRTAFDHSVSTHFAGSFTSSLGAYIAGFGALDAAIAFPVDQYWHTLYGVDVSLWAPFHIMAIASLSIAMVGVIFMLLSASNLANSLQAVKMTRVGYAGVIVAWATFMGVLTWLIIPSLGNQGYMHVGNLEITVYPLMYGTFGAFILIAAVYALPGRFIATAITLVYLVFGLLTYWIVPLLMTWLVQVEQLSYRRNASLLSLVATQWQYELLIAAVLLDLCIWFARRHSWSLAKTQRNIFISILSGFLLAEICNPFLWLSAVRHGPAISIIALSLLPGLVGAAFGYWLGWIFGAAASGSKR